MDQANPQLDRLQGAYRAAIEEWIAAIRKEEGLASTNHSVAQIDRWEQAHFREEDARNKAKAAKAEYQVWERIRSSATKWWRANVKS